MTDSEFINHSDAVFAHIEQALEDAGLEVDTLRQGNVLELEFDNGDTIIVNRHEAQHELWIAAKSGGYHFIWHDGQWLSTKTQQSFFDVLSQALTGLIGYGCQIEVFGQ